MRNDRGRHSRALVASVIGNALEVYDFSVYALYAVIIGREFFPTRTPFGQLMLSVSVFGAGFAMRPLGALLLGAYADRAGRKPALTLTLLLMACGTGLLAVTPNYASIGIAAPVIVVLARLLQGFSAGGEIGAATTYLVEIAPPGRRGLYTSLQSASQGLSIIAAGLTGFVLASALSETALANWGWRIPFLMGALIGPVGLYLRRTLDETLDLRRAERSTGAVLANLFGRHRRDLAIGIAMISGATASAYVVGTYMTTYAVAYLHLSTSTGMLASLMSGAVTVLAALLGGRLSDRFGRTSIMVVPLLALIAVIYPAFLWISTQKSLSALLCTVALLTALRAVSGAAVLVRLSEIFPAAVRGSGLALAYSLGVTLFGGSAQPIVTWLIEASGDAAAPSWYLIALNLLTLAAILVSRPARATR